MRYQSSVLVTPCGLRDYGVPGQLGLEKTPEEFIERMVEVFRGVWRVLRDDGTLWLNIGDSYAGNGLGYSPDAPSNKAGSKQTTNAGTHHGQVTRMGDGLKPKDLCLIPERLALALQADGWYVRSRIAWCKKSSMPESVTDRPTSAWEHLWLLTKSARYYYDAEAVKQPSTERPSGNGQRKDNHNPSAGFGVSIPYEPDGTGANLRNYWVLGPEPYPEAHFATFPSEIPRRCIKAGTSQKGACSECGAPWERVVDLKPSDSKSSGGAWDTEHIQIAKGKTRPGNFVDRQATTTGWQPTCDCDAEVVPCTVLDPFLGSGTTAAVAQELDREWVGIELNPEYAALAEKRINAVGASQIGLAI
jgi:DNA modification methylase